MKAYGIFPGAAREDDLIAVVAYGWEDYREIFGGRIDDYKDFLLERRDFIRNPADQQVVRVMEVPWDKQSYREWLAESVWSDEIDAHGAWALEVVKDRGKLRVLKEKYPVLPAAPEDEEITAEVSYALIPFVATSEITFRQVSRALPEEFLQEVLEALRAEFAGLPFEAFSARRGEGVAVMVGNRFVTIDRAEGLAEKFIDGAPNLVWEADILEQGVIPVPRQMRVRQVDEYPAFTLLLLPVIFIGASRDVDYAVDRLWKGLPIEPLEEAIKCMLEQFAPDMGVQGIIPTVPWYLVKDVVDDILEQLEAEENEPGTRPNLRRIK